MSDLFLPQSMLTLLGLLRGCFSKSTYATFTTIVAGWVHCLGRHTVTGIVIAAGAVGVRHIGTFHRFFSRAQWSLDAIGRIIFLQALKHMSGSKLIIAVDDTLSRKSGKCISLASMHHDPLLSSGKRKLTSFGHNWVIVSLWIPCPGTK